MRSAASPPSEDRQVRCPACGAWQAWSDSCRRCRCDLTLLRRTAAALERSRRRSLCALRAGRTAAALRHAQRWYALAPCREAARLLAVCHLLEGHCRAAAAARLAERRRVADA